MVPNILYIVALCLGWWNVPSSERKWREDRRRKHYIPVNVLGYAAKRRYFWS